VTTYGEIVDEALQLIGVMGAERGEYTPVKLDAEDVTFWERPRRIYSPGLTGDKANYAHVFRY